MKKKYSQIAYFILPLVIATFLVVYLLSANVYPRGSDIFGHLYKADFLFHSIKGGEWYPLYSPDWYNGVELFRYWPPFSYYVLALLEGICKGDIISASVFFVGVLYLTSMSGWILYGKKNRSYLFPFIFGNLFFFSPDYLRVIFSEGNVPMALVTAMLPLFFFFLWQFLHEKKKWGLIGVLVMMVLIISTHLTMALLLLAATSLFCIIFGICSKDYHYPGIAILNMILAQICAGMLWVRTIGGDIIAKTTAASVETIRDWAQNASLSLNPFYRLDSLDHFYFGLSVFFIALIGVIACNKDTFSGFFSTLLVFLGTTTVMNSMIKLLPFSHIYWMHRFVPIGLCLFFISLMSWEKLKKKWLWIFVFLLTLDTIPSLLFFRYGSLEEGDSIEVFYENTMEELLVKEGKEITENRMAILDMSEWGSYPTYYLCKPGDNGVFYTFGRAYQGASTISNIVSINEAFENGFYTFVFDRLLEMGNDTILIPKDKLDEEHLMALKRAANMLSYDCVNENEYAALFHLALDGQFGSITSYESMAIGTNAECICYIYPQFGYADRVNINDFSFEELKDYKNLYLSGFEYDNKKEAESLLNRLADSGVKIFIDMQHTPMNKLNGKVEFMGVYAQPVTFTERFPILEMDNGSQFKLNAKTEAYDVWNTVYLSSLQETYKVAEYDTKEVLPYVGINGNKNIVFIGFNTVYYYAETRERSLLPFLSELFMEEPDGLPARKIVPLKIKYSYDGIRVLSEYDNVNTNIAKLDCFAVGKYLKSDNNMIVVNAGTTNIGVKNNHSNLGVIISIFGWIVWIIFYRKINLEKM